MWFFMKDGFISVGQCQYRPNNLLVSAYDRAVLVRLFPKKEKQIRDAVGSAFRFVLMVSRKELAKMLADCVMTNISYGELYEWQAGIDSGRAAVLRKVLEAAGSL